MNEYDDKLLPCPFCGGRAKVDAKFNRIYNRVDYRVRCKSLNCTLRPKTEFHETQDEAIRHWNTRKPMEKIEERLKTKIHPLHNVNWNGAIECAIDVIKEK